MDDEKYGIISFGNSHFVLLIKTFQLQDDSNAEVTLEDGANLNPSTNNLVLISDSSKLIEAILWKVR